jgi:hypothetical protein
MPERLHLARTFGVPGWQERHVEAGALVLAALVHCLRHPATSFTLRGLWRIGVLWRERFGSVDPGALRLALCLPRAVTLADVNVRVAVATSERNRRAAQEFSLVLRRRPARAGNLPVAPAGSAWNIFRLEDDGETIFEAMIATLLAARAGTHLVIDVQASARHTPGALGTSLPLRAECRLEPDGGWIPLLRSLRLNIDRLLSQAQ